MNDTLQLLKMDQELVELEYYHLKLAILGRWEVFLVKLQIV